MGDQRQQVSDPVLWERVRVLRGDVDRHHDRLNKASTTINDLVGKSGKNGRVGALEKWREGADERFNRTEERMNSIEKAQTAIAVKVGLVMSAVTTVALSLVIWALTKGG